MVQINFKKLKNCFSPWNSHLKPAQVPFITAGSEKAQWKVQDCWLLSASAAAQQRPRLCPGPQYLDSPPPLQCPPLLLLSLFFIRKHITQQGLKLLSSPSYLILLEKFLADEALCTRHRPLFFFLLLIHSLPLAQEPCLFCKAEMSFPNCVYLLALWCESTPRQLHINLVSSLYLFSSASFPWPNLWLSFPLLSIVMMTGSSPLWVLRPQPGTRPVLSRQVVERWKILQFAWQG